MNCRQAKKDYIVSYPQEEQSNMLSVVIVGKDDDNEKQLMTRKPLETKVIISVASCLYFHKDCI